MKKNIMLDFLKENKSSYSLGIAFVLISSYIQTLFPKILGNTIDILKIEHFNPRLVKVNILFMLLIGIGTFISTYIWRNLIIGNGRKLECYLREKLFDNLQRLSPEFYNKRKTGDLIAYSTNDVSAVRMAFGPATALSVNGIVICIASIYSMSQAINLKLTLLSILPLPFIIFFMLRIGKIIQKRFRIVQENYSAISDRIQENIYGIRVIKAYVQEKFEHQNFEILNNKMLEANLSMVKISSFLSPIIEISFSISFVLNLIFGGNMVLKGTITLGDFIAFNTYLALIMQPVISIGRIINIFQRGTASLKRLSVIFDIVPTVMDGAAMINSPIKGDIELVNLNFSYPGTKELALKNINIKIPRGHTLGIIGKTGCGKSTLANLLLKLYNVEEKSIFLDGIDIMDYALETLRESIGYIPQDNFLFSATIKDNITFFNDSYSKEQLEKAAQYGCIHESIVSFPEGFNTLLGDRGVNLSGGQKQRVSISRCLIKNPNIIILDDALSAVDSITEKQIINNLKTLRKDKTAIIIAHKISTVMYADEIIVLDKGKISERGTHKQLIAERGLYYDIFKEQFKDKDRSKRCEVQ
jgi:ATP-binding cassette, subfamily B, multidrug efflux pump